MPDPYWTAAIVVLVVAAVANSWPWKRRKAR